MKPKHISASVFDDAVRTLREWCSVSSASHQRQGLWDMARRAVAAFETRGFVVDVQRRSGLDETDRPVVVARSPELGTEDAALLAVGHLDTVLEARPPEVRGNRLFGSGALDMKAGIVAFLAAVDTILRSGAPLPDGLRVVLVPDEEVSGPLSVRAMEEWGPKSDGLWVLEPGGRENGSETLVGSRRGSLDWSFDIRGRAAHAGSDFWSGRSALVAAADLAARAHSLSRTGAGPTVNPARLLAGDDELIEDPRSAADRIGTVARRNVVPDRALLEGEARCIRRAELDELESALERSAREVADEHDLEVSYRRDARVEPRPLDPRAEGWIQRARDHADERGWSLVLEKDRGGLSFSNFLPTGVDIPVLDGLGPIGEGMHTRDEWVCLASLDRRIDLLAHLLRQPLP